MEKWEIREQKLDAKPISSAQYQVPFHCHLPWE